MWYTVRHGGLILRFNLGISYCGSSFICCFLVEFFIWNLQSNLPSLPHFTYNNAHNQTFIIHAFMPPLYWHGEWCCKCFWAQVLLMSTTSLLLRRLGPACSGVPRIRIWAFSLSMTDCCEYVPNIDFFVWLWLILCFKQGDYVYK